MEQWLMGRYGWTLAVGMLAALATTNATADGLPLDAAGRYPNGKVSVFTLTPAQKAVIDCLRVHQTDNTKTPYLFQLTLEQSARLRRESGLAPAYFQVYETYRGFNDAGPHWNLALRFSEAQIEVPHQILKSDKDAAAEVRMQGWAPNPEVERLCKAEVVTHSEVDVVRRLYRDFAWEVVMSDPTAPLDGFMDQPLPVLTRYLAPQLAALIRRDRQCAARTREICRLDFVPLWDSQDPLASDLRVAPSDQPHTVSVQFLRQGKTMRLAFDMVMTSGGPRIADIRYADGRSLVRVLEGE